MASRELAIMVFAVLVAAGVGALAAGQGAVAVALPPALVAACILFIRPVIGLYLLAATIPLEAAFMVQGRSAPALVGMAVFAVWASQKMVRREPILPMISPGLVQGALVFFAFACLSMLWADFPRGVERRLLLLFQLILLTVLVFDLASSWARVAWVLKILVLATTIAALLTIEQYFIGGVRRAGEGIVGGINRTALTLVMVIPFAFYLVRSKESLPWRLLGLAYIGLAGVAIAATLSRMNFLLYPLVIFLHLAIMARTRGGRRRVFVLGGAAMLFFSFLPMEVVRERAETIAPYVTQSVTAQDPSAVQTARGYNFRMAMAIFRDHPIIGAGYQNYNMHFLTYQWEVPGSPRVRLNPLSPHNSHIAFLANLGIVGFLLWQVIFGVATFYVVRTSRLMRHVDDEQPSLLLQSIGIALGLLFLYGFYTEIHQDKLFWLILGLLVAVDRLARRESLMTRSGDDPVAEPSSHPSLRSSRA